MKNCLLLFPACLLGFTAAAQPEKGQFMLNLAGNAGWSKSDGGTRKHHQFTTHLSGAYFLNRRFAVGLQAEYHRQVNRHNNSVTGHFVFENRFNELSIAPMARYYFRPGKKTSFFLQATAGYQHRYLNATLATGNGSETAEAHFNSPDKAFVHLTPGFAWYPTSRLALEVTALEIGYEYTEKQYPKHRNQAFGVLGLNPKLGITYLIGGKKPAPLPE